MLSQPVSPLYKLVCSAQHHHNTPGKKKFSQQVSVWTINKAVATCELSPFWSASISHSPEKNEKKASTLQSVLIVVSALEVERFDLSHRMSILMPLPIKKEIIPQLSYE